MKLEEYVNWIKLELTGGILELEIPDTTIADIIKSSLAELQTYITMTRLVTVPYSECIDISKLKCSRVVKVYRVASTSGDIAKNSLVDPLYGQRYYMYNINNIYSMTSYIQDYAAWLTTKQIASTMGTDLQFEEDKDAQKLYVATINGTPKEITIKYVPKYEDVSEITSDFFINIIKRYSLAYTKVILGRVRTRFTQSNALWTQDGETMLTEGNEELNAMREALRTNKSLFNPVS